MKRLVGLDSIRFLCAAWVAIFHLQVLPPVAEFEGRLSPAFAHSYDLAARSLRAMIEGQSAVIVFFLISGLCIHFPYRNGASPQVGKFLVRRYTRIMIPLAGSIALTLAAGHDPWDFRQTILWSLFCEIIYYTLYPVLLMLGRRIGWWLLTSLAFVVAFAVVAAVNPQASAFSEFGHALNWVVGLPSWLLGCLLAEEIDQPRRVPGRLEIWSWRGLIFAFSVMAQLFCFHSPLGFPIALAWTLNLFALLAYFWLSRELRYLEAHPPPSSLEAAGRGSYSLYLMHPVGFTFGWRVFAHVANPLVRHMLAMGTMSIICLAFYRVVERPSHRLSQKLFASVKSAAHPA